MKYMDCKWTADKADGGSGDGPYTEMRSKRGNPVKALSLSHIQYVMKMGFTTPLKATTESLKTGLYRRT